jgi:hypothetical protein
MIQNFVDRFLEKESSVKDLLSKAHPESYKDLIKMTISSITAEEYGEPCPDPERIVEIDHGEYQGTLVYVIAEKGYQPCNYYYVKVSYGSCSVCDTLQDIQNHDWDKKPDKDQIQKYWTLMLHIVQALKQMNQGEVSL